MRKIKLAFSTHYADCIKKNKDVGMHPSIIFEDDKNYYVIHLTSTQINENEYAFICKNIRFGEIIRKYHECYISKNLANVPKDIQIELSNCRKFKIMKTFELGNKKELLVIVKKLLEENYFNIYNASFKRSKSKIRRNLHKEIENFKEGIEQKIKDL